ncbi:MAG TPA: hypothetical protein VHD60_02925 [Candidatus Saccharimonadales bacterium]|nr:hypothetical protein [Candidatus Saccharimonadales bacterium]
MDKIKLRSTLVKSMLYCLVAAAAIAVVTILIGKFSDTTGRALGTIFVALIHIGLVFGLVSMLTSKKTDVSPGSTEFVVNTSIIIAVLSFFTSVFAIWQIVGGTLPLRLYTTYVIALFALVHVKTLIDVDVQYWRVRSYVLANYVFIAIVSLMLLGDLYVHDPAALLSGFYGRLLAASAVVDVTLSVIVAVMYRLYLQQHPELVVEKPARAHSALRIILAVLFFFFFVAPLLLSFVGALLFSSL